MTKCSRSKFPGSELVHHGGLTIWVSHPRDRVAEQRLVDQLQRDLQNRPQRKSTQEKKKEVRRAVKADSALDPYQVARIPMPASPRRVPQGTISAPPLRARASATDSRVLNAPTGPRQLVSANQMSGLAPAGPRVRDPHVKSEQSAQAMPLFAVPSFPPTHPSRAAGPNEQSQPSVQPVNMSILDRLEVLLHPTPQLELPQNLPAKDDSESSAPTERPSTTSFFPSTTSFFPFSNPHGQKEQTLGELKQKLLLSTSPNQRSDATEPGEIKESPHRPIPHSHPNPIFSTPPVSRSNSSHGEEGTIPELRRQAAFWRDAWEKQSKEMKHLRELRILKDRELAALSEMLTSTQEKNHILEKRNMAALNALRFQT